jgi:hypothetical protein
MHVTNRYLFTTSVFLPTASEGAEAASFHTFLPLRRVRIEKGTKLGTMAVPYFVPIFVPSLLPFPARS